MTLKNGDTLDDMRGAIAMRLGAQERAAQAAEQAQRSAAVLIHLQADRSRPALRPFGLVPGYGWP